MKCVVCVLHVLDSQPNGWPSRIADLTMCNALGGLKFGGEISPRPRLCGHNMSGQRKVLKVLIWVSRQILSYLDISLMKPSDLTGSWSQLKDKMTGPGPVFFYMNFVIWT